MRRTLFKSKIHRATVTHADLEYEGSITIDEDLMDAAGIWNYEAIHVWNITRGTRLQTYAIRGPRGSGVVCINGAAAHLNEPGDLVRREHLLAAAPGDRGNRRSRWPPPSPPPTGSTRPTSSSLRPPSAAMLHRT